MSRSPGKTLGAFLLVLGMALAGCTSAELATHAAKGLQTPPPAKQVGDYKVGNPYQIAGVWYYPKVDYSYDRTGVASWYGPGFHGKLTANGETYDENAMTAAHPTLPMPSIVRVTNLENGRSIVVRINDRGPFKNGRLIDMSRRGSALLGFQQQGTAKVRVQVLEDESRMHAVLAQGEAAQADAPEAVPMVEVAAAPLDAPGGTDAPARNGTASGGAVESLATGDAPWPDGKVTRSSVGSSRLYVQAGAFLRLDNATRLSIRLSRVAKSGVMRARVGEQRFYRVRLGPLASVADADRVLKRVLDSGHRDARIVVQ